MDVWGIVGVCLQGLWLGLGSKATSVESIMSQTRKNTDRSISLTAKKSPPPSCPCSLVLVSITTASHYDIA